jgi:hypothetical protein
VFEAGGIAILGPWLTQTEKASRKILAQNLYVILVLDEAVGFMGLASSQVIREVSGRFEI